MTEQTVTTNQILEALKVLYPKSKGWLTACEVTSETGDRRADFVAWNVFSGRIEICEVKMDRSDWLRELKDPSKAGAFLTEADAHWVVAPGGVVATDELPDGWGLLEVAFDGSWARRIPGRRFAGEPSRGFVTALLRRVLSEDWIRGVEAAAFEAGQRDGKNKAARERPPGTYTKQDLENEREKGWNERDRLARKQARKAEGRMS